jgi:hypothetical protein
MMNPHLMRAIAEKRLIEFVYGLGGVRIVEPHDYGIRAGVECLLGFQIGGDRQTAARHGWKQFELDQMHHDAVTADGHAEHTDYRGVYDGSFGTIKTTIAGKVTSEGPLQLCKLDPRTRLRIAMRKDGTLNGIIVRRLASDGRSITSSILRFDNDGRSGCRTLHVRLKPDTTNHRPERLADTSNIVQDPRTY